MKLRERYRKLRSQVAGYCRRGWKRLLSRRIAALYRRMEVPPRHGVWRLHWRFGVWPYLRRGAYAGGMTGAEAVLEPAKWSRLPDRIDIPSVPSRTLLEPGHLVLMYKDYLERVIAANPEATHLRAACRPNLTDEQRREEAQRALARLNASGLVEASKAQLDE